MPESKDKKKPSTDEEDVDVAIVVDALCEKYPDVSRGAVYEAAVCITDETFLLNYLKEKQAEATYVDTGFKLSDVFTPGDTKELMAVIDLGKRAKTSKNMIISAAAVLGIAKTLYHVFTDDNIKKQFEEIDAEHASRMIEDAKNLTKKIEDSEKFKNKNKE